MCGILGAISNNKLNNFTEALSSLKSRGPDNQSTYIESNIYLGHTRLSIIDTDSRANQPFIYEDYIIIFNGEIYNFKEIKEVLIQNGFKFKTSSDTEVLLYSYIHWGNDCTKYLDGMWAFCIYDKNFSKLFLSRDRIGEKPLIYYKNSNTFLFGSELNPIIQLIGKDNLKINNKALSNFNIYNFRHIPSPYTPYENIFKLEPGYNLIYDLNTNLLTKFKYFEISDIKINNDAINQFDKIFQKSVKQTCYADVPVGIFLSGGIDSSLISSIMKDRDIRTYSLGYDKNDPEIIRAEKIAKKLGLKNKKLYFKDYIEKVDIFDVIKYITKHYGEPINLIQIIYADLLLKEMKKDGIKVAVGGNGADELFYGYDGMNTLNLISDIKSILDKFQIGKILNNNILKNLIYKIQINRNQTLKSEFKKFCYTNNFFEIQNEIKSNNLIDKFSWLGFRIENEHSITIINDIAGSINSMELRTPFLNRDVINFACCIDKKFKITSYRDKINNKFILKKTLENYLSKDLIYQKKMGFGYNIDFYELILKDKEKVTYYIKNITNKIDIYDYKKVLNIFNKYINGNKINKRELVSIILVSIWYELFII